MKLLRVDRYNSQVVRVLSFSEIRRTKTLAAPKFTRSSYIIISRKTDVVKEVVKWCADYDIRVFLGGMGSLTSVCHMFKATIQFFKKNKKPLFNFYYFFLFEMMTKFVSKPHKLDHIMTYRIRKYIETFV